MLFTFDAKYDVNDFLATYHRMCKAYDVPHQSVDDRILRRQFSTVLEGKEVFCHIGFGGSYEIHKERNKTIFNIVKPLRSPKHAENRFSELMQQYFARRAQDIPQIDEPYDDMHDIVIIDEYVDDSGLSADNKTRK